MLRETYKYETTNGIYSYIIENNKVSITSYEGNTTSLPIPHQIAEIPVARIDRKAFMGNRYLQHITLPDSIEQIGDWAFSRCNTLQTVVLPNRELSIGKQVFQKSESLSEITFPGCRPGLAKLLAASVTMLDVEYLLNPEQAGKEKWYQNFDNRMLTVLKESEENALKNLVYCAEEDMCGKQADCIRRQSYEKARLALHRLTYDDGLSEEVRKYLTEYVRQRTVGCADESVWKVVKDEITEQKAYCEVLVSLNALHENNFDEALEDLDENHIELKAFLMQKWQERNAESNVWDTLSLE